MAARRDNQGIQIAMIVFILTTLAFMLTTYLAYSSRNTLQGELEKANSDLANAQRQSQDADRLATDLLLKIGLPGSIDDATMAQVQQLVENTYGQGLPPESQNFVSILQQRDTRVASLSQELATATSEVEKLRTDLETERKTSAEKLANAKAAENAAHEGFAKAQQDLQDERQRNQATNGALVDERNKMQTQLASTVASTSKQVAQFQKERDDAQRRAEMRQDELNAIKKDTPDQYDGRIVGVVAATKTVLLDIGSDDGARAKLTFGVYDAEESNVRTAKKKASIEITRVLSAHRSEAKITDPNYSSPIVGDDFIYSPIWSPGSRLGVALVGAMDIDEDGRDDREYLINLIELNGGRVDAQDVDDKQIGEMTVNTRYIIVGDGELTGAATQMLRTAKEWTIERMSVGELVDLMSPPGRARSVTYGGVLRKGDFAPKPNDGVNRVSTGTTSFRKRTPTPRRMQAGKISD